MSRSTRTDFYDFDSLLTEEEIAIRDAVGDWVDERFLPLVEKLVPALKTVRHFVAMVGRSHMPA